MYQLKNLTPITALETLVSSETDPFYWRAKVMDIFENYAVAQIERVCANKGVQPSLGIGELIKVTW